MNKRVSLKDTWHRLETITQIALIAIPLLVVDLIVVNVIEVKGLSFILDYTTKFDLAMIRLALLVLFALVDIGIAVIVLLIYKLIEDVRLSYRAVKRDSLEVEINKFIDNARTNQEVQRLLDNTQKDLHIRDMTDNFVRLYDNDFKEYMLPINLVLNEEGKEVVKEYLRLKA